MAHVVLLRGVNVGGHRTSRPAALAKELKHLSAVNIGAAGTFVFLQRANRTQLRTELAGRLPFNAEIMICQGREIVGLRATELLSPQPALFAVVRFVSVLARVPRSPPRLPMILPSRGHWMMKVLARDGRFVIGQYRRQMRAVSYLGRLDRIFGVPGTTRNWNTMAAIVKALNARAPRRAIRALRHSK